MDHADRKDKSLQDGSQMSLYEYQLKEVNVRLVLNETSALYSTSPIITHEDAARVMGDLLRGADREMVCVVNMDNKMRPINYNVVSIGGLSSAMVPVANCFKTALLANASAVLLLHSHPSGDPAPSQQDFDVTERFVQAGKLLDIAAVDHVIIGAYQGEQYSIRENHPEMFYSEPDLSVFSEIDPAKGWSVSEGSFSRGYEYDSGKVRSPQMMSYDPPEAKSSVIGRLSEKRSQITSQKNLSAENERAGKNNRNTPVKRQDHSLG